MRPKSPIIGDGFVQELLPLMKNGFVILRSILDVLIERIEEVEKSRDVDVRKEIYASIVDALNSEIENIEKNEGDTQTAKGKIEVLEAVIAVLLNEMDELEKTGAKKKTKRPQKVKID